LQNPGLSLPSFSCLLGSYDMDGIHRHCSLEIVHIVVDHLCELIDEAVLVHGRIEKFYVMGNVFNCAVDYL